MFKDDVHENSFESLDNNFLGTFDMFYFQIALPPVLSAHYSSRALTLVRPEVFPVVLTAPRPHLSNSPSPRRTPTSPQNVHYHF